jgi:hypothetical protein
MINRRQFIGVTASLVIMPKITLADKLKIRTIYKPDDFCKEWIEFI